MKKCKWPKIIVAGWEDKNEPIAKNKEKELPGFVVCVYTGHIYD